MTVSSNEAELVAAIESGKVASFSRYPSTEPGNKELSAAVLHKILFGVPILLPGASSPRAVSIPNSGVRVYGATIVGDLNLEDITGAAGVAFPRLEFEACWFEGEIQLSRCRLASLSLKNSSFRYLNCSDAVIEGPVSLWGVNSTEPATMELAEKEFEESEDQRSAAVRIKNDPDPARKKRFKSRRIVERPGQCWVVFAGARIGGRFNAARGRFAAPRKRPDTEFIPYSKHARYALDLRGTQIRGSVTLRPYVSAYGGVCLTLARVEGSVWCSGAEFTALEESSLSADYVDIQGSIYMRPYDRAGAPSLRFRSRGCLSLFAARIGGSLYLEGSRLRPRRNFQEGESDEERTVLTASNATIGGNCVLRCWQSETPPRGIHRTIASGDIYFRSMRIRSDLLCQGAILKRLTAPNIEVGGRCIFSAYTQPDLEVGLRFLLVQAIFLDGGILSGDLDMSGASLGRKIEESGLSATGVKIGANCRLCASATQHNNTIVGLPFRCSGQIFMREATIGNSLNMEGACIFGPAIDPAVDLSGTTIGSDAMLRTRDLGDADSIRFIVRGGKIGLRLAGTRIAQKLNLNGAILTASTAALSAANIEIGGKASLGTYPGHRAGKQQALSFIARGNLVLSSAVIRLGLDMVGADISAPGPQPPNSPPLRFEDREAVPAAADPDFFSDWKVLDLTLARMKFAHLREDYFSGNDQPRRFEAVGKVSLAFAEIDTELNLEGACFRGPLTAEYAKIGTSVVLKGTHLWSGSTDLFIKQRLAKRSFSAAATSNLSEGEDSDLEAQLRRELRIKHTQRGLISDFSLHAARIGEALEVRDLKQCEKDQHALGDRFEKLSHTTIDLRALHVEELQDVGGSGWGSNIRFWLDGLRYKRLPEVTIKSPRRNFSSFAYTGYRRFFNASWKYGSEEEKSHAEAAPSSSKVSDSIPLLLPQNMGDEFGTRLESTPLHLLELERAGERSRTGQSSPTGLSPTPRPAQEPGDDEPDTATERTLLRLLGREETGVWQRRLHWLDRQYFNIGDPLKAEFSPDAYEQLVDGLNTTGSYNDARRIASARITYESRLTRNVLGRAVWATLRILFDYGLSEFRAVATFAMCIILGTAAVWVADYGTRAIPLIGKYLPEAGQVLVMNTNSPESAVVEGGGDLHVWALRAGSQYVHTSDVPCKKKIRSWLYALDVFVPVLDLRQQNACSIAELATPWRYSQAAYALLGWIVTPLTILTLSGILRRHLEK